MKKIIVIPVCNSPEHFTWTKHNIAKDFVLWLFPIHFFKEHSLYYSYETIIEEKIILFIIPKTYMNIVGNILNDKYLSHSYKNDPTLETILIHDDLEISFGKNKFRNSENRGERGHNGLRSYTAALKQLHKINYKKPFYFSLGIGRPTDGMPIDQWVLKKFNTEEITILQENIYPLAKIELYNKISLDIS